VNAYWLVMPAAGSGRRFGSPKQHALLAGRTVLQTALQLFIDDARCRGGSVVHAPEDQGVLRAQLPAHFALTVGGANRSRSVYQGLLALESRAAPSDWVLVHDAARPCLSASDLERLLEQGWGDPVGALLAIPVADTVKRADAASPARIERTVARDALWLAQTPQMFRYRALRAALEGAAAAERVPTDEAQAMEWAGFAAQLVQARDSNLKVTSSSDLALAEAILRARRAASCA
jgi:2-C-methyl-D-erythritol 4-phosphate cytidylyltransferase